MDINGTIFKAMNANFLDEDGRSNHSLWVVTASITLNSCVNNRTHCVAREDNLAGLRGTISCSLVPVNVNEQVIANKLYDDLRKRVYR